MANAPEFSSDRRESVSSNPTSDNCSYFYLLKKKGLNSL